MESGPSRPQRVIILLAILLAMLIAGGPLGCVATTTPPPPATPEPAAALPPAASPATESSSRGLDSTPVFVGIAAGEIHRFGVELPSEGGFLVVALDQRGIDLRLALVAPDGHELAVADGAGGPWSVEHLAAITRGPGPHGLEVGPRRGEEGDGSYRLEVRTRRERRDGDEVRLELERQVGEALQRRDAGEPGAAEAAREMLAAVADRLREDGELEPRADVLHALGVTCMDLELAEEAQQHFERELELRRRLGDRAGEAAVLVELAGVLTYLERSDEALEVAHRAREIATGLGDPDLMAGAANAVGVVHFEVLGDPRAAVPLLRTAAELHLEAGNLRDEVIALSNLGIALMSSGEVEAGCLAVIEAGNTARRIRRSEPGLPISLGYCHRQTGRFSAAMAAFQEAIAAADAEGHDAVRASAQVHVGSLLAELGEYRRAEHTLQEALPHLSSDTFRIAAEVHLGWLAMVQGDPASAIERFEHAREVHGELSLIDRIRIHNGIGTSLAALGRLNEALEHLETARSLSTGASGNRLSEAESLRQIGKVQRLAGDRDAARATLEAALAAAEGAPPQQGAIYHELARLAAETGQVAEGLELVRQAIELREKIRSDVAPPSIRASFLARWRDDFSLWIDLLLRAADSDMEGSLERAFAVSERAHARTLQELLIEAGDEITAPAALLERQRKLTARLDDLVHRYTLGDAAVDDPEGLLTEIRDVETELGGLEWQLRRPPLEREGLEPLELGSVQDLLGEEDALLEYALGEERSFLFVVRRSSLAVEVLPPAEAIAERVAALRRGLYPLGLSDWRGLIEDSRDAYRELLAPAEPHLEGVRRLIIVPDRELFYLPFEILLREVPVPLREPGSLAPHYVVSHWDVGYAPSATVLAQLHGHRRPTAGAEATLLAFADSRGTETDAIAGTQRGAADPSPSVWEPLPGARSEVRSIAALLPSGRSRIYEGSEATTDRLLHSAGTPSWLHFAVHGHLDPERPTASALVLADRYLSAREIYDLDLDAELVVLSACQTGLGKQVWGEELIGLSRAFFYAGVPAVVMSLWKVADDSTSSLMVEMYGDLLAGAAPIAALSKAKRSFLGAGSRWQHPYFWAPFILFGAPVTGSGNDSAPGAAHTIAPITNDDLEGGDHE
jgi:CHAT domain-containing protein/tetratricopeptide (TPR) repeat protein